MIRRQKSMRFLGGFYAFPGGKVDPEDGAPEILARCRGLTEVEAGRLVPSEHGMPALAFWVAAARELLEETGVLPACDETGRAVAPAERIEALRAAHMAKRAPLPALLAAEYVAEDNTRRVPVMLHRAIVGSLERFIGILIENYAGALPLWLSPIQVVVLTITDRQAGYAREVTEALHRAGYRAASDLRNEKITYKIREHSLQKLPYQVILGDKELQAQQVAVRTRAGEDLGAMPLDAFIDRLEAEAASRP